VGDRDDSVNSDGFGGGEIGDLCGDLAGCESRLDIL
jgi:hypothetical protein